MPYNTKDMTKKILTTAAQLKELNAQLKKLQAELLVVNTAAGKSEYIALKKQKSQSRLERIKKPGEPDRMVGHFLLILDITAKKEELLIPLSIASGKKQTGFIYQIEGTGESSIVSAQVRCTGEGITQVTFGTIVYAKIPARKTVTCTVQVEIRGKAGKSYIMLINRLNYKFSMTDARYTKFNKEIPSTTLKFS